MISGSYTFLLLAAVLSAGGGILLLIAPKLAGRRMVIFATSQIAVVAKLCGILALLLVLMAAGLHFVFGHSATTAAPMHFGAFLLEHRALMIIGAFALLVILLARRRT